MFTSIIINDANDSEMQLESLLTEIDNYGEEFLHCGKSSTNFMNMSMNQIMFQIMT